MVESLLTLFVLLVVDPRTAPREAVSLWQQAPPERVVPWLEASRDLSAPDARGAWTWASAQIAQRLLPSESLRLTQRPEWLPVLLSDEDRGRDAALFVVAGPPEMWAEVPEHLLPRWPVVAGRAFVPRAPRTLWRLRVVGEDLASEWVDAAPSASQVALAPLEETFPRVLRVSAQSGAPVRAPVLWLSAANRGQGGRLQILSWFSGAVEGTIQLPSLPLESIIAGTLVAPGFLPARWSGKLADLPEAWVVGLGATVTGRVADLEGSALPGSRVLIEGFLDSRQPLLRKIEAWTDEEGLFRASALPLGPLALVFERAGFARERREVAATPDAPEVEIGEVRLFPASPIRVLVADPEARVIAGARVRSRGGSSATTADDGIAELGDLPAGVRRAELEAGAPGFLAFHGVVPVDGEGRANVELRRGTVVRGRLVGGDGVGLAGAVQVQQGMNTRFEATGHEGSFELTLEPHASVRLVFSAPGVRSARRDIPGREEAESVELGDISLGPGAAVSGRWLNSQGKPIAGGRVWTPRAFPSGPLGAWLADEILETTTDSEGCFRLEGFEAGDSRLRLEAPSVAPQSVQVRLAASQDLDIGDLAAVLGGDIAVSLPVVAVEQWVIVEPEDAIGEMEFHRSPVVEGHAHLRAVPLGRATVRVQEAGREICRETIVVENERQVLVDCALGGAREVTGEARDDQDQAIHGRLHFSERSRNARSAVILRNESSGGARSTAVWGAPEVRIAALASGGRFATDLAPGEWSVVWENEVGHFSDPVFLTVPEVSDHQAVVLVFPALASPGGP